MGTNVKSILFCTTSLCLWCYILHFISIEKTLMVRCEFYTLRGHQVLEFTPVPICKESPRTWSYNPSWPKTGPISPLPSLERATWDLFQDLSDSGVPSPDLGTPWTYCSWHSEECMDSFSCKSSDHMKSKLCPQNIAVQINAPFISLSCIKQNLLRFLFWWNGQMEQEIIQDPVHTEGESFQTRGIPVAWWRWIQSCNIPRRIRQLIFRKYLC